MTQALDRDIEAQIEQLGFELVELERAGSRTTPILRIRIDRPAVPEAGAAAGVGLGDCARVSRSLEAYLEEREDVPARYVLEVSSPGVERPLTRPRDFRRFTGERVAVLGVGPLAGGAKRVEGELLGLSDDEGAVLLRPDSGVELAIEREKIKRVHLVYRWSGEGREG